MPQKSLVTLWQDGTNTDRAWYSDDYLPRLNPTENFTLININKETGVYDFSYADMVVSANPSAPMTVRPYADDENFQWKKYPVTPDDNGAEKWLLEKKKLLNGRPYRITVLCEPAFKKQELTDLLAWLVVLMEAAVKHNQPISIGGFQPQLINAFTNDEDDLLKGKWLIFLKVAGESKPIVRLSYHTYTGAWLPAGTYDDDYLRKIADDPELLRDKSTWATWGQITDKKDLQRYRTRHLFRHLWLNYLAEDKGYKQHDYAIEESPFDFYGNEEDLKHTWQRLKDITGFAEVSGVNEGAGAFAQWKNPSQAWAKTVAEQLIWYGQLLANDPNCKVWALYCISGQAGEDRQPYNWGAHRDILEMLIGKNPVSVAGTPTTPPVPPPAPIPVPTPPKSLEQRVADLELWRASLQAGK